MTTERLSVPQRASDKPWYIQLPSPEVAIGLKVSRNIGWDSRSTYLSTRRFGRVLVYGTGSEFKYCTT